MRVWVAVVIALGVAGCGSAPVDVAWLAAPARARIAPTVGGAVVTWSDVEGAQSYTLYVGRDPATDPLIHEEAMADAVSPTTLTGLTAGETWYVVIAAQAPPAVGSVSPTLSVEPIAAGPDGLTPLPRPAFSIAETNAGSRFGYPLTLGDLNGDGAADLVTAAYDFTTAVAAEGRVFAYLGGDSGLATSPAWTADGPGDNAAYGAGLALGDVNGDGDDDVLVGAPDYQNPSIGYADLFLGVSGSVPVSSGWSIEGPPAVSTNTGRYVSMAGDVDGDGYEDFVVASHNNGPNNEGQVFVFRGDPNTLPATPTWTFTGEQSTGRFGWSLPDRPGDVNGDGAPDMLVSAVVLDDDQVDEGRAYLYLGTGSGYEAAPVWTADGNADGARFGHIVAWAGDVNGDGYDDVLVGAVRYSTNGADEGAAFLFLGGATGPSLTPDWMRAANQAGALAGDAVAGVGDLNGDGYDDVVLGCPGFDDALGADAGRVELFLGGPDGLTDEPQWSYDGGSAGAGIGGALVGGADLNGDATPDFVVGTTGYFALTPGSGGILAFDGPPTRGIDVDAGSAGSVRVGEPAALDGAVLTAPTWSDVDSTCEVDWGDGATSPVPACTGAALDALSHSYAEARRYTVRVTVTDAYGVRAAGYTTLQVE